MTARLPPAPTSRRWPISPTRRNEALAIAAQLCRLSQPSLLLTKECVNRSFETPLEQGLAFERLAVHSLFATDDRREGMQAFADKRQPAFSHF